MEKLVIDATSHSPAIVFDPGAGKFTITGVSRPEDVRAFYYPVLEWLRTFLQDEIHTGKTVYDEDHPLILEIRLKYFNSSSAKFLFDIFSEIGQLKEAGQKVIIRWYYDEGDDDMLEAGEELSEIAEIPFEYIEV